MITKDFVDKWSSEYHYKPGLEGEIIEYFASPREFLNRTILYKILDWKAARVRPRLDSDEDFIRDVTKTSFSTTNERLRIEALCLLKGVRYRVASTVLHFRKRRTENGLCNFNHYYVL